MLAIFHVNDTNSFEFKFFYYNNTKKNLLFIYGDLLVKKLPGWKAYLDSMALPHLPLPVSEATRNGRLIQRL